VSQKVTTTATADQTPREVVEYLDRYIVGQNDAKRAVSIAIRNRWRRRQLPEELRQEVSPKNILMIGPTGVGKTEIARRLAKMTGAPFTKVEATKFTEVGYYGRNVESMIRDLLDSAINIVRQDEQVAIAEEVEQQVENELLDLLIPRTTDYEASDAAEAAAQHERAREQMRVMLRAGKLEERNVTIRVDQKASVAMLNTLFNEQPEVDFQGMFEDMLPKRSSQREATVAQARRILTESATESLLDEEKINAAAIELTENLGIIFLDELDKVVASGGNNADVSRQGVQRDLLPIVEGTTVQTRQGYVKTDHILFIAAGAFHQTRPSELMPELQGRFPIRVELSDLSKDDFIRILTEPRSSLTKQYTALMKTEGVDINFSDDAIEKLADYAYQVNQTTQNIGARRLYTILERLLEELSFEAPDMKMGKVEINAAYVAERLEAIADDEDLSKFIL